MQRMTDNATTVLPVTDSKTGEFMGSISSQEILELFVSSAKGEQATGKMCPIPVALRPPVSRLGPSLKSSSRTQRPSYDPGARFAARLWRLRCRQHRGPGS